MTYMKYVVNLETCWMAGFWAADRGSTAKGVVAINNTNNELLNFFRKASLRNFDITESRFRERTIKGYGVSKELYFTRLPARRFIEKIVLERQKLGKHKSLAFLGGRFDGDGTVSKLGSSLCYYYGNNEAEDLKTDKAMIESLGFKTTVNKCGIKALRLNLLRPRFFASKILPFVRHSEKRNRLKRLIGKRQYGAKRTRPAPYVTIIRFRVSTHRGPLLIKQRKERSTAGPYALNPLGYTRPTMAGIMGCNSERRSQSSNPAPVQIGGCNSPP